MVGEGIKKSWMLLLLVVSGTLFGQISSGKIVFERKTNLEKKFKDMPGGMGRMKDMLQNNKIKIDLFELYFNDTCSVFKPIINDDPDPLSWATTRNTVYQSLNTQTQLLLLSLMGQEIAIADSIGKREWKITESTRKIGMYECRKAIWEKNDSTRIYAWFSVDLVPSTGPEGFSGLPGTILGLATEDGGIIYFAKSVEIMQPKKENLLVESKKKKFTYKEFQKKIDEDYGNTPWGKRLFADLFRWM